MITLGSVSVPAFTFELTVDNVFDLAEVWLYEANDMISMVMVSLISKISY